MPMMTERAAEDKNGFDEQLKSLRLVLDEAVRDGLAVHELERQLFKGVLSLGRELLSEFFVRQGDGDVGERLEVEAGRELVRSAHPHARSYLSLFGEFRLERYVYAPRAGQRIEAVPLDARLRLPGQKVSYLLLDWTQRLTVEIAYRPVSEAFERMFDLRLPVSLLERQNRALGGPVDEFWQATPAQPQLDSEFIVASADGKGVPMRRCGKREAALAASRRGPKANKKRMAIVGAVYEARAYQRSAESVMQALFCPVTTAANDAPESERREKPLAKVVRAALPPADDDAVTGQARETLFGWLGQQVRDRDPSSDKPVVVLIDGQHCLWDDARSALPGRQRIEILDLLHATGKLAEMVQLFYPPGHDDHDPALRVFVGHLLSGRLSFILRTLRAMAGAKTLTVTERETLRQGRGYFVRHRHRMRYHRYLAQGYPIASGVIEGACRHVVKDRLERSGMRWVIAGAQPMLDLRCVAINGQWDAFNTFFVEQQSTQLYPYADQLPAVEWPMQCAA